MEIRREDNMSDDAEKPSAEMIPLHPLKATKASERKWGKPVMELGFCVVPSLLLRAQARLKLTPTKLALLMHLADYWWDVERKPYPSKKTLGERLGLGERQVQRHIAELEEAKLVQRIERRAAHRGKLTNEYDLSGLVARLKEIEPEFRKVEEEVKEKRRAVARPGIRPRRAAGGKA
jgi:DNA-binding MarR family transcriptional regulator